MAKAIFEMTKIGSVLSDKSRVTILLTLLGGPRTAGELAKSANIKPQTATSHLNKMLDCNLITKSIYGKYHYYKLASKEIASFLETMLSLCKEDEITSLKQSMQSQELKNARLCYDHVAGKLGILIRNFLLEKTYIVKRENKFILTSKGISFLKDININTFKNLPYDKIKEDFQGYECFDWSEDTYHIGGNLGKVICDNLFSLGWVVRHKLGRELKVTPLGSIQLIKNFDFTI